MFRKTSILVLVIFVFLSCRHEQVAEDSVSNSMSIKTGTICGWCSKDDTLSIKGNAVRYINFWDCRTNQSLEKKGILSALEWNALVAKLDFDELKKLNLNTCNYCADGCDEWLLIEKGSESHYIRFGIDDPELKPIKSFLDELYLIKARYSGDK